MVSWLPPWEVQGVLACVALALLASIFRTAAKSQVIISELTAGATNGGTKQLLLVIAHPDDESMFFLPLLLNLRSKATFHLLCLSTGNFDNLGAIRKAELAAVWTSLRMQPDTLTTLDDPRFQDGMKSVWTSEDVAATVAKYANEHAIDAIFTFDEYGVSGHPNHISVHHGVKRALHHQLPSAVNAYALESTPMWRKYIGALDVIFTEPSEAAQFVSFTPWENYNAMALHHSQFVWFRRLFVIFSRYTYINTFTQLRSASEKKIA
ncbi:hypothetical protein DYB25_010098 [Aphanomyces astaci]|uniref:N-acetylglucosaminylphosphatidylinositol deacetylase n=1 Tax=Aphanomyces astaci TaxID=112090 RepID=A0A397CS66_APHAT|nr:hypothetical protein DYB25_010098 [Aphanomyces astaci]RHY22859.1 hypothetical protein DYB36_006890 [Aphanomyces astaci]RHY41333.1 hypothetical protein DYB34_007659 [Aphanomyces astaci]RHY50910.1 hypothetical protein DYB38_009797 [Aphanomyces astaci]RHY52205.1 hypothetical protein DYB30_010244 [Aphanomyces astaci]